MEHGKKLAFTALAQLVVEYNAVTGKARPLETNIRLDVSPELDASKYMDDETIFTKEGGKIMTEALTQALIANIHICHEHGFRDSAEHLRYVLKQITEGFSIVPDITKGYTDIDSRITEIPKDRP